jgi:hypothetical protein
VVVFEGDGLEVRPAHTIELDYSGGARFIALASGVALHDGMALVRNHRGAVEDLILKLPLPDAVARGPVQPFGSQRLIVVGDRVVTGNHGELEVDHNPNHRLGLRQHGAGRIVVVPVDDPGSPEVVDVDGNGSITALARVGDRLITGGRRGELDAWSLDGRWQRQRIREATRREPPSIGDLGLTSTYLVDSIVDVCAIPHGGAASVSIGGELCLFDAATRFVSHGAPGPGSPRSLAAHPDGGALAVGIKQRGIHAPRSIVAIVDLRPPIEDAWRTPAVRSLAQAASARDAEAFVVLADALETAGASAPILHHLRHHDHALTSCWVVDALVAA